MNVNLSFATFNLYIKILMIIKTEDIEEVILTIFIRTLLASVKPTLANNEK